MADTTECPACGSSPSDREKYAAQYKGETIPIELRKCRHCGSLKCCMCDMGDDVQCLSCEGSDD